eukprot:TRINITY_DN4681_c0_g1_i1.p2 TRINITY_DN4681_c0_g1~~TRINITY_DN4681_c0_g1_i1.p2  ORF type:complete len:195 (+),score=38.79 TRINITY_DN4681_c0_g1_i1:1058-1642(+)
MDQWAYDPWSDPTLSSIGWVSDLLSEMRTRFVAQVFVMGTTTRPDVVDTNVAQQFRSMTYCPLPDLDQRMALIEKYMQQTSKVTVDANEVNLQWLAELTAGNTVAEVVQVCQRSIMLAVHESRQHESVVRVRRVHLQRVLQTSRRCCTDAMIMRLEHMHTRIEASRLSSVAMSADSAALKQNYNEYPSDDDIYS